MTPEGERLLAEIAEQSAAVERTLRVPVADARRAIAGRAFLYVVARGSSDHAATYGKYLFESHGRTAVALGAPSLFTRYHAAPDLRRAAVIGISQSGAAPDIAAVLRAARADGAPTIAVTNTPRSAVARAAAHVLLLDIGRERAVAATKTYTATCLLLARLAGAPVAGATEAVAAALRARADAERIARRLRADRLFVLGRGPAYATALEIALKVKELAQVWAEGASVADFAHGPIALAGRGATVLLVGVRGPAEADVRALARRLAARRARVLALTDDPALAERCDDAVLLASGVAEHLMALALVVPGQYLARALAVRRGLDPDRPAGLRKVTRTR